jgi:quercetin dioxygenase-like cupin family protein
MKRLPVLVPILVAVGLALPVGVVIGQQPPAPVPVLEKRFEGTPPPGPYDMNLLILDFAPGAATPTHSHGGPVFLTVVDGTLWERSGGQETVLNAGDTLMEEPGRVHAAGNEGPGTARLLVTVLLPKGAAFTTIQETGAPAALPPGPTVVAQATLESPQAPGPLDVVQRVTDLPAGGVVAQHTHPGPNFNILLQGQLALDMQGTTTTFKAGDSWVEPANVVHGASNTGATTARIMGAALVPRGAPVAAPAQQPAGPAAQPAAPAPAPVQLPRSR